MKTSELEIASDVPDAPDTPEDTAVIRSAPTFMDSLHDNNTEVDTPIDIAALEELWFNPSDPYDLSEADRCNPESTDEPAVMRSNDRFWISDYVKLDSRGLSELIEAHGNVVGTGDATVVDDDNGEGGSGWNISDYL
ncbi:hypothetical protein B0H10DRAFT_1968693 [Mycena sp. CBHHK59/15]|nr:hypothetical protein B0H10DRAFT_1968693 [Mycena sp. CBHHK59/15]